MYVSMRDPFTISDGGNESPNEINGLGGSSRALVGSEKRSFEIKLWKSRRNYKKMVLGRDMGLKEVSSLSLNSLVGCFSY
jgi:hypothetical protein